MPKNDKIKKLHKNLKIIKTPKNDLENVEKQKYPKKFKII